MNILLIEEIKIDLQDQCTIKVFQNSKFPNFLVSFDNLSKSLYNDPDGEVFDDILISHEFGIIELMFN